MVVTGLAVHKIQWKQLYFAYKNPHRDLHLEVSTPAFLRGTLAHDNAPSQQVLLQKVEWFRRYYLDKIWTHEYTEIQSVSQPPYPQTLPLWNIRKHQPLNRALFS